MNEQADPAMIRLLRRKGGKTGHLDAQPEDAPDEKEGGE